MLRNVLISCFFLSSSAARSPQGRPQTLARSLLNVTDYISNLDTNDPAAAGRAALDLLSQEPSGVPFLKSAKLICDVNAPSPGGVNSANAKFVHMVVGNLHEAEILGSHTYVVRVDYDATGELGPASKVLMDAWDPKFGGKLKASLNAVGDAVAAKEESMANAGKSKIMLGKAYTARGLEPSQAGAIFTGGTSEHEDVVPNGGTYFTHMNYAYKAIWNEATKSNEGGRIHSMVMAPLGAMESYAPKYVIDKDVLLFFTGNVFTHDLMTQESPINDIYIVLPDEPANVLAMCKYCQYRSLKPIAELGSGPSAGICAMARDQSGASIVSMLFVLLAAAWW